MSNTTRNITHQSLSVIKDICHILYIVVTVQWVPGPLPWRSNQLNSMGKSSGRRCHYTYLCTDLCFCPELPLWIQFSHIWKRGEKIRVIVAQWRHLKHLNEHGCTHNWAGINHENKFWTPISHLDDLFSRVLLYNSRMCFPYVILGWAFKNKTVRLS